MKENKIKWAWCLFSFSHFLWHMVTVFHSHKCILSSMFILIDTLREVTVYPHLSEKVSLCLLLIFSNFPFPKWPSLDSDCNHPLSGDVWYSVVGQVHGQGGLKLECMLHLLLEEKPGHYLKISTFNFSIYDKENNNSNGWTHIIVLLWGRNETRCVLLDI